MKMKVYTVCARAQASIFMVFWPFSQNKIVKLSKKSEQSWPNRWSKVQTLEDKPRSGEPFFHKPCEKYYRKSCKYLPQNRKVKKFQFHIIDQFRAQLYGNKLQKKVWNPWREKGRARFMQVWCQKDLPTLYQRRTGRQTHVMWTPKRPSGLSQTRQHTTKIQPPKHWTS